ncbi:MAG: ABC transporter substrate-binding protein [Rhodobacteraceae bacterium]|nr:ABC transporter substrate-binding protein [Paracoccaceae bacterium]
MRRLALAILFAATGSLSPVAARDLEPITFGTNWVPQAEDGGFYQALADGTYAECGLDVSIVPGGPQVNNRALLLAGKLDFNMGGDLLQSFSAVEQGVPIVALAAIMQKHPQVILAHPEAAETWEDLKKLKIMISMKAFENFYRWMMSAWGFTEEQRVPYTFNPAPFLVDPGMAMQGYLTSEPYLVEKEGGFTPRVFLLADAGYSTYATLIETMQETIETRPETVSCFVNASIKGWYAYLYGDPSAANELIKAANPEMTDDKIAYAIAQMKAHGIVDSGDAESLGIGVITEKKVRQFYDTMVASGVVKPGLDISTAFTTEFIGRGVGLDLKR